MFFKIYFALRKLRSFLDASGGAADRLFASIQFDFPALAARLPLLLLPMKRSIVSLFLAVSVFCPHSFAIDRNSNGMSDIWEMP